MKVRSQRAIVTEMRRVERMIDSKKTDGFPMNLLLGGYQALSWCLCDNAMSPSRVNRLRQSAGRKTAGRKRA